MSGVLAELEAVSQETGIPVASLMDARETAAEVLLDEARRHLESIRAATDRWVYVLLPYATFALRITDGVIAEAPPIAKWALGKPERTAAALLRERGAVFSDLPVRSTT